MSNLVDNAMFVIAIVQFFICLFGFLLNGFLAYVIIRNKKLRRSCCGIFILIMAIYDCVAEFFIVTLSTGLYLSHTTIPLLTCFWLDFYCVFAQNLSLILMTPIGIDRLISIVFPVGNILGKTKFVYFAVFLIPPWIYMAYMSIFFYQYSAANAEKPVYCMPSDYVDAHASEIGYYVLVYVMFVTLFVYTLIWLLLRVKVVKIQNLADQRIYKSLFVLMLVTFFCWLPVPVLVSYVFPYLHTQQVPADVLNVLQRALLQLNKVAQDLNVPILSGYRKAMRKEFNRIFVK